MIEFPPFRLDPQTGRLWRGNHPVALRPKAWAMLRYLLERPGELVAKDELQAAVWGDTCVSDDTLTRTLAELRRALHDDAKAPRIIETVHRRGVRFVARLRRRGVEDRAAVPHPSSEGVFGGKSAALVGRDAELARLGALFHDASTGHRQVVFIEGEPGIGKSAIVEAFAQTAHASQSSVLIAYGQCIEQYGEREPYMAVLEALERLNQNSSGA